MAFTDKMGGKHTNHSTMKHENMRHDAKMGGTPVQTQGEPDGDEGAQEQMGGMQDGAQMAEEHGPATHVSIEHDNAGGVHTVHAEHPDGHAHDTQHGSMQEAHQYAQDCSGGM
jgi:hypothetical protein